MMRVGSIGVMVILAAAAAWGCGDDETDAPGAGAKSVPASKALSKLTAAELEGLCAQLLGTVRDASTPEQQCIEIALASETTAPACEQASELCVSHELFQDFDDVRCTDFTGSSAVKPPKFECDAKVSEVTACYAKIARWIEGLRCSQAGKIPEPPECVDELNEGDCKFGLAALTSAPEDMRDAGSGDAKAFECQADGKSYDYDFGGGDACNACATGQCCSSFVSCEKDADCACYWDCLGQPGQRDCKADCGITDYPDDFTEHASCLIDNCATPCDLND